MCCVAIFDSFWIFAALTPALVFMVLLMKRSVAEKGAHIGSERVIALTVASLLAIGVGRAVSPRFQHCRRAGHRPA